MEEIDLNNKEEQHTEEEKKNEAEKQKQNWSEKRKKFLNIETDQQLLCALFFVIQHIAIFSMFPYLTGTYVR